MRSSSTTSDLVFDTTVSNKYVPHWRVKSEGWLLIPTLGAVLVNPFGGWRIDHVVLVPRIWGGRLRRGSWFIVRLVLYHKDVLFLCFLVGGRVPVSCEVIFPFWRELLAFILVWLVFIVV